MRVIVFSLTLLISSTVMAQNYGRSNGWTNPSSNARNFRQQSEAAWANPYWGAWYLPSDVLRNYESISRMRANENFSQQLQWERQRANQYQQQRGGLYGTGGYGRYPTYTR